MATKVQPLGENVLIKPEKASKKTESGIYLPETAAKHRPQEGKVIAVGDSKDIKVKKGQKVIFSKFSGTEITVDGEDCLIVKSEEILAIVD